ncbi:type II toxin-antitoxin system Phd/YefM family antitoxin [Aerococcus loyolae]|uniref:Antitoxin n=1 Tax=Aerococcus urinae TaxID=1376 RepID=A0A2I1L6Q6_9LACT|nr:MULTISPECIES: type II toxin-antitoxin system prevent-host-death family antitoxin [Aerococcus]MCY3067830.1 type II toxin-antitoxin system prevent-host-death family antitoxin [Aerococcus mictus]MCY3080643.1 type II toxin-antitoxin system prevent-host-death family antitoxin [Aerococcus mictus]MDK6727943.1 type II toxin-antitoxin system prevent-host-death family antitoxin [Aerococcus urinae]MDK7910224.1 type II toxin-antitoxin system prevent-host-death family antitoxin [Aerococcus urinae]MDK861
MEITNYSDFRQNMKKYMDVINEDSVEYTVTSQNGNDVVVMSKSDFDSLMETYHLLSSRANRENLYQAMEELDQGDYEVEEI